MIQVTNESITAHLKSLDLNPEYQEETDQVYVVFNWYEREFPLFIRILDDAELVQLLMFMPMGSRPSAIGELARLLHYLNKEIDTPGFGMDETSNVIFYRVVLPTHQKKLDKELLNAYLNCAQKVTETFFPAIVAVSQAHMNFEEFLKKTAEASGSEKGSEKE